MAAWQGSLRPLMAWIPLVYQTYSLSRTLLMRMWERVSHQCGHQSARPVASAGSFLSTFTKHSRETIMSLHSVMRMIKKKKGRRLSRVLSMGKWTSGTLNTTPKYNQIFILSSHISGCDAGCPFRKMWDEMREEPRAEQNLWEPFCLNPPAEQHADKSLFWRNELSDAENAQHLRMLTIASHWHGGIIWEAIWSSGCSPQLTTWMPHALQSIVTRLSPDLRSQRCKNFSLASPAVKVASGFHF